MQNASAKHFGYNLDLLFEDLKQHNHILVAVSGGSDSVALLYLLYDWAKDRDGLKLSVATIDHGLRGDSADEARHVGQIAKKLGLRHIIEKWMDEKPASAVSQKAREARYALLSKIAHDVGATVIALGHNRDDQRETIVMRAKRAKFSDFDNAPDEMTNLGLAGMYPYVSYCGPPDYKSVALARPVLSIARAKLRLFLERMGECWIDDPSNEDDHYERVRLRKEFAAHPSKYPTAYQIGKFADRVATYRQFLAFKSALVLETHVHMSQHLGLFDGVAVVARAEFCCESEQEMRYLLRMLIGIVGGRNYLVSPDKANRLVKNIQDGSLVRSSIGSVVIELQKDQIRLWRENRNLPVIKVDELGKSVISWDGRIIYRFSDLHIRQQLVLRSLGADGIERIETDLKRSLKPLLRKSLLTQPAIFKRGELVLAPTTGWWADGFVAPEIQDWAPSLEMFQAECDVKITNIISQLRYPSAIKAFL